MEYVKCFRCYCLLSIKCEYGMSDSNFVQNDKYSVCGVCSPNRREYKCGMIEHSFFVFCSVRLCWMYGVLSSHIKCKQIFI